MGALFIAIPFHIGNFNIWIAIDILKMLFHPVGTEIPFL
jgi:hypothetical protein